MPRFPKVVLAVSVVAYLALGLWFLVHPEGVEATGLVVTTPGARAEVRATYGGMELGLAAFLAWCLVGSAQAERLRAGLWATALATGGFGAGRALGLLLDRPAEPIFPVLLAVEVVTVVLAALALRAVPQEA